MKLDEMVVMVMELRRTGGGQDLQCKQRNATQLTSAGGR